MFKQISDSSLRGGSVSCVSNAYRTPRRKLIFPSGLLGAARVFLIAFSLRVSPGLSNLRISIKRRPFENGAAISEFFGQGLFGQLEPPTENDDEIGGETLSLSLCEVKRPTGWVRGGSEEIVFGERRSRLDSWNRFSNTNS